MHSFEDKMFAIQDEDLSLDPNFLVQSGGATYIYKTLMPGSWILVELWSSLASWLSLTSNF